MSATRRDTLFAAITSELEGITVANGFNLDVSKVEQDELKSPDDLNSEDFPAAFIIDTDETKENADVGNIEASLEFIITGYVRNAETPQTERRKFQQDVERAITADRYQGQGDNGWVVDTQVTDIKTDKGLLTPFAIFDMTFTITYWHEYGTP